MLSSFSAIYLAINLLVLAENQEMRNKGLEQAAMLGVPSIFALIVSLIARRYQCLIELATPVFAGGTSLTHLIFNVTMHNSQINA